MLNMKPYIKLRHANHVGFIHKSYKENGINPYDTVYSYAQKIGAMAIIEKEFFDSNGAAYPLIKFKFEDGSMSRMDKDTYQIIK